MKIWEKYRNLKIGKEFGNNLKFEKIFTIWEIGSLKKIWKFGEKKLEIRKGFGNLEKIWKFRKYLKIWKKNLNIEKFWKFR